MGRWSVAAQFIILIACDVVYSQVKRLQICRFSCESDFCKKFSNDVEFEFELSKDFLLPPCAKNGELSKQDLRVTITGDNQPDKVVVELDCHKKNKCFSKTYAQTSGTQALAAKLVDEITTAITHDKAVQDISAMRVISKPRMDASLRWHDKPVPVKAHKAPVSEDWDKVIILNESRPQEELGTTLEEKATIEQNSTPIVAKPSFSVAMSFGGENWNYVFEPKNDGEMLPIHSRIYPRALLSLSYWPTSYLRMSSNFSASFAGFRLKANQLVNGDGQMIMAQLYQSDFIVSLLKAYGNSFQVGADVGYEFLGAFVDNQKIDDRPLTIIPGYQSHALRLGPRIIVGAQNKNALLDIGIGFYPYAHYFELPNESGSVGSSFVWSIDGALRLMLGTDIFADTRIKATMMQVSYENGLERGRADGEKWGPGQVRNTSLFATFGLGCLL